MGMSGNMRSSSFFQEFGRDRFECYESAYKQVLAKSLAVDNSFCNRVTLDIVARMDMYRKMYGGVLINMGAADKDEFLVDRTLRTMAQYLALGRLIGESAAHPAVIVHPTRNKGMFNARNKFLLPDDGPRPQPTIPVFEMKRRVY